MSHQFHIKRRDTSPSLDATLTDDDGNVVDITGASVRFHMMKGPTTPKVDAAATIVNAVGGEVRYSWIAADTDEDGRFNGEFEVTYSGGEIETFPNDGYLEIIITEDVA